MLRENVKFIKPFIAQDVAVGIKHPNPDAGKLYYFFGNLIGITDKVLILKYRNGIKEIFIEEVLDVHLYEKR